MDKLMKKMLNIVGATEADLKPPVVSTPAELEVALCDLEETYSARLADIENALCDMDGGE